MRVIWGVLQGSGLEDEINPTWVQGSYTIWAILHMRLTKGSGSLYKGAVLFWGRCHSLRAAFPRGGQRDKTVAPVAKCETGTSPSRLPRCCRGS